jgi:hypothetical protein
LISGGLDKLDNALDNYFGALNEHSTGMGSGSIPEKPDALVLMEQSQALGLPFVGNSVIDQPYIWLQEVATVIERKKLWDLVNERSRKAQTE